MKEITCAAITETVRGLLIKANYELPPDAESLVRSAPEKESVPLAIAVSAALARILMPRLNSNCPFARIPAWRCFSPMWVRMCI